MTVPRQRRRLFCLLLLCCSLFALVPTAASAARHIHFQSRALFAVSHLRSQADQALVADARRFARCVAANQARPRRCGAAQNRLQHAGIRLAAAERHLARLARAAGRTAKASGAPRTGARRSAPQLSTSGESLSWSPVAGVKSYVLRRRVSGQGVYFAIVHGTSATPAPVPGASVSYAVRTSARRSYWSAEASVSYTGSSAQAPNDRRSAPAVTLSGQTLSWPAIAGVRTYILKRSLPGRRVRYTALAATSFTIPAGPAASARFSVRSAVVGSAWATPTVVGAQPGSATAGSRAAIIHAAAIRAAARAAESTPTTPVTPAPPTPSGLIVGVDTGSWRGNLFNELAAGGIRNLRVSDTSSAAASEAEAAGCTIAVLTFQAGGTIGGRNPGTYASEVLAYARQHPEVRRIEALNEPELLPDSHNYAAYVALLKATHEALASLPAAARPKLIASWAPTYGFGKGWAAAGGLPYVDEVVVHAYGGGTGQHKGLEGARELVTQAHAESGKPVAVTEIGWPTAVGQPSTGDSQQWSEPQQAAAITGFAAWAHTQPYISVVMFFNAVDYGSNMWYGIERTNRSHKPSFAALAAAAR